MSKSVLYMSMSLDGYIAGPNDQPGNPGGDGFVRLHEWYGFAADAGPTEETSDSEGMGKALSRRNQRNRRCPLQVAIPWNRPITGVVITTMAFQSLSPVTGRRGRPSPSIHW